MSNLEFSIKKNYNNNTPTILTYTVPKTNNLFNGIYPVYYDNIEVASIEWSNNPSLNSKLINNVIHGYLKPNENKVGLKNIPNGLFIGTVWFKNNNVKEGLSVSNSLTTIYNLSFIISIDVESNENNYIVNIILNNPEKKSRSFKKSRKTKKNSY